jgi:hypothetical protein
MSATSPKRVILYDAKLRRPGCVLLAAVYSQHGADRHFPHDCPTESWLVSPTPDLSLYEVDDSQYQQLVARAHAGDWETMPQDGGHKERKRLELAAQPA